MAPIQEGTRCCCKELAVGPPPSHSPSPQLCSPASATSLSAQEGQEQAGVPYRRGGGTLGTGGPGPALGPLRVLPALSLEQKRDF